MVLAQEVAGPRSVQPKLFSTAESVLQILCVSRAKWPIIVTANQSESVWGFSLVDVGEAASFEVELVDEICTWWSRNGLVTDLRCDESFNLQ